MAATFYQQAAANRRNSFFLVLVIVAMLGILGAAIGYATTGVPEGRTASRLAVLTPAAMEKTSGLWSNAPLETSAAVAETISLGFRQRRTRSDWRTAFTASGV